MEFVAGCDHHVVAGRLDGSVNSTAGIDLIQPRLELGLRRYIIGHMELALVRPIGMDSIGRFHFYFGSGSRRPRSVTEGGMMLRGGTVWSVDDGDTDLTGAGPSYAA